LNCSHTGNSGTFDYISVTPPYEVVDYAVLMRLISESPFLGDDTFIVRSIFSFSLYLVLNFTLNTHFFMQVVEYPLKTDMLESCGHLVKVIKVINVFAISRNIHFFLDFCCTTYKWIAKTISHYLTFGVSHYPGFNT
jgi:hypothetical protein